MDWMTHIATAGLPWPVTAVFVLLAIGLTKGVDARLKLRRGRMEERSHENSIQTELIERLTARLDKVETKLEEEQAAHLECVHKMGTLEGKVDQLTIDMDQIIRRHDDKTQQQIKENLAKIAELEEELRIGKSPEKPAI